MEWRKNKGKNRCNDNQSHKCSTPTVDDTRNPRLARNEESGRGHEKQGEHGVREDDHALVLGVALGEPLLVVGPAEPGDPEDGDSEGGGELQARDHQYARVGGHRGGASSSGGEVRRRTGTRSRA